MNKLTRRSWIQAAGASASLSAITSAGNLLAAGKGKSDSLPTQLYKSLSDSQKQKLCLPVDHPKRQFISNWWYIHPEHRIPSSFTPEQQELIRKIFESMHSPEHRDAVNNQVLIDQYGEEKNAPSAGFFGTPEDENFEFIFTGHHVTRRCNARFDKGHGFGGAPIFYGHYPHPVKNGRENFTRPKSTPAIPTGIRAGSSIGLWMPSMAVNGQWAWLLSSLAGNSRMSSSRLRPRSVGCTARS